LELGQEIRRFRRTGRVLAHCYPTDCNTKRKRGVDLRASDHPHFVLAA
jgi:hypothetical protein